ncbi:mucin-3A isoform X2 [Halyomorpha halys]|uniref:mucin-3A isoform X2 n=1 Tax=Halyomorpha halys TaxID=286706 RepID=UPI0006D51C47|nr:mucin-17 isoform X1 [Halyomorpha halys]
MADGRKHDDVKVIKNPLLSQSLLLEELSGVSFLVPASPQKNEGIVDYGSKTDVDVPLLGEKKQGSPITEERGVNKDGSQSSQTFTDIPLNTTDPKIPPNDKSVEPSQGLSLSKKEPDSGQYTSSSTSFFSFFLPSASPSSQNVKAEINPSLDKNEHSGQKRLPSPQVFEPQLIPPSSEPAVNSSKLTEYKITDKPDLTNFSTAAPLDLVPLTDQSEKLLIPSEPPRVPLPPTVSAQNIIGLKNPYALRNTQNFVSSFSHLSKSPPSSLGSHDSIPLYSPSNLFNYLSGPQVTPSSIGSESLPPANIINKVEVANNALKSTSITSDLKLLTQIQSTVHESISLDTPPILTNIFSPQTTSSTPNTYSEFQQKSDVFSAGYFPQVTSQATFYPVQTSEQIYSQAGTINLTHTAEQAFFQPTVSSPNKETKENSQTELKTDISSSELKANLIKPDSFASLNSGVSGQSTLAGPSDKIVFTQQPLEANSKNENSVIQPAIPYHPSATQPISKILHGSLPEKSETPYLPPIDDSKSMVSSVFSNQCVQEKCIKPKVNSYQQQSFETGSTIGKCVAEKLDIFPPPLNNGTEQNNLFKTGESHSAPIGFQSKQVTMDNNPSNENYNVEINADISKNILINNSITPQQSIGLSNLPSISGYFKEQPVSTNTPSTESSINTLSSQLVDPSITSASQSSESIFFGQVSSSGGWNQQILAPVVPDTNNKNSLQAQAISENNRTLFQPSAVAPNSELIASSQQTFNVQNQPDITKNTPDTPIANISLHHISVNSSNANNSVPSNVPSLYPQPLYTFPKLNSDSYSYPFQQPGTLSSFPSVPSPANLIPKMDPAPTNPLIPTFSYFSSSQTSCLPPSLDEPVQKVTSKTPPSSYYFKPIQKPDSVPVSYSLHSSIPTKIEPIPHVLNPIPSAPPKTFNIPPPNVYYPKENTPTFTHQANHKEVVPPIPSTDNLNSVDSEELDQIPLEGSAVPLFNPETVNRRKSIDIPVAGNTFRLSKGLKKPTYAPVPDLGVTERRNYLPPTSPSGLSVSSQEEMAAIHENQNVRTSPSKAPESPLVVENYHGNDQGIIYRPPYQHWFFKSGRDKKSPWTPFSMADSLNLEQVFTSSDLHEDTKVATDGGRYDVEIVRRKKNSVYWDETPGEVRRCSWFVKSVSDSRYIPYDENIAALLEDEYKQGCETNEWNRRVELADGEVIILHGPSAIAHHVRSASPDAWSSQPPLQQKSRVVKRGVEDFDIPKGEPKQVDHLLLVVHGIGKACDLRFRSLVDVVDDFRSISLQLVQSHFHSGVENGMVGRVEVLPVEWHKALHTETIDDRLSAITLPSIPRAREFTNETLLDILFYTSPVFCEKIVQAVGAELNRVFTLYQKRNPGFRGQVSLGAHSLGSLILFDMLCHQQPVQKPQLVPQRSSINEDDEDIDEVGCLMRKAKLSRRMSYLTIGPGTGQPYTIYPQLLFQPKAFFALGSPIGMFITVRGVETLGDDFRFPTCPAFFNIFHPNDPVAYRIEALIKPEMASVPAVLIPHHKGRKRMHLELKETMAHVTAALKQKLVHSMKNTWNAVYQLAMFNRKDHNLQGEVSKVIEDEVLRDASYLESDPPIGVIGEESTGNEVKVGRLNDGRRIDYVLQEAPLETFNQYISAIRSHLVYWESEDTMLLILKEIYGQMGIAPDSQVPQPILPFDISGDNDTYSEYTYSIGAPPTQFVRK